MPISVMKLKSTVPDKDSHPPKALSGIIVNAFDKMREFILHPVNVFTARDVTFDRSNVPVKPRQLKKASVPMVVILVNVNVPVR